MKDLLILHGALGTAQLMEPLKEALATKFKVHLLTFSGHGSEAFDPAGFGIATFAQEVEGYLEQNGLQNIPVFGYSMGGYVALYLETVKPGSFSQIVTFGTKFDWNPEAAQHETARMVPAIIKEKVPQFAALLAARHTDWEALMEATTQMMRSLGESPLLNQENLSAIQTNTTILLGDADNMVSPEESKWATEQLKNGRFELLEDCPHPIEKVKPEMLSNKLISLF